MANLEMRCVNIYSEFVIAGFYRRNFKVCAADQELPDGIPL